ncbi:DNA damage responsive protein [Sparganum proliferum]
MVGFPEPKCPHLLWFCSDLLLAGSADTSKTDLAGVNKTVEAEKESSSVQNPPFLLETTVLPTFAPGQSADNRSRLTDLSTDPVLNFVPQSPAPLKDTTEFTYVIVVIVCCLGLLILAGLLFFLCRKVHQRRQLRLKKKNPKRLLSPQPHHMQGHSTQGNFHQCTPNPSALCAGPVGLGATSVPPYCLANNSASSATSAATGAHQAGLDSRYSAFNNGFGPEDLMKLQMLQQQQQQQQQQSSNYDSSLSFASPVPLMLRGGCYLDPYAAAPSDRVPVSDLSRHQSLAPTIMSPLLPAPPPASSVALAVPSSIAVPQQPPSLPPPAAVAAPTSGFYPPPPDQPLPPLPPATPVSASAANSLLSSGARNSTINPYAASSLNGFLVDDNGMVMSTHTDGSMAEYASASLVNGQTGRLPIRPPSIHGLSPGFSCQQQQQSQQPPTASSPNAGMMCLVSSGAGPVLNNVGGGLPAVANAGAYPFMLPAGYLARLPPTQGAAHDGVLFPASEQHQAATCAASAWYPANYASEHLLPHHSNRRAPAFISSDTLRSIDTLPRDPPSISHPPPMSFCKPLPSRFPPNGDNNGEVFDSTCAQR